MFSLCPHYGTMTQVGHHEEVFSCMTVGQNQKAAHQSKKQTLRFYFMLTCPFSKRRHLNFSSLSLSLSLPPSLPPSLPACLPACLPPSLPPFLPPCLPASLPPCLPASLSLPASLPASLPLSLSPSKRRLI